MKRTVAGLDSTRIESLSLWQCPHDFLGKAKPHTSIGMDEQGELG